MKTNKSLFEKRIELKDCQINGGKLNSNCHKETSTATKTGQCSDVRTVITSDSGEPLMACSDYVCK